MVKNTERGVTTDRKLRLQSTQEIPEIQSYRVKAYGLGRVERQITKRIPKANKFFPLSPLKDAIGDTSAPPNQSLMLADFVQLLSCKN
jgi:hypothetical protein